jgi:integrase/recombinase XerC
VTDLPARRPEHLPAEVRVPTPREVYEAFLRRRSKNTLDAYRRDLEAFAKYRDLDNGQIAAEGFIAFGGGYANQIALGWQHDMLEEGLAPATVNRRLSSLRSLVKIAGTLGMIAWSLKVENVPSRKYRDTAGPGAENVKRLLTQADAVVDAEGQPTAKGRRDAAIAHLLFGLALRRFELLNLDVADVDFGRRRLQITGKGRTEPEYVTMTRPVVGALERWLELRGRKKGPLFTSFDPAEKGNGRLVGSSIRRIVKKLGAKVGLEVWPHALRHSGVTAVLEATDGDVRAAQKFARHKNINTTMLYDDTRRDLGGEAAEKMADYMDELGEEGEEDGPNAPQA